MNPLLLSHLILQLTRLNRLLEQLKKLSTVSEIVRKTILVKISNEYKKRCFAFLYIVYCDSHLI